MPVDAFAKAFVLCIHSGKTHENFVSTFVKMLCNIALSPPDKGVCSRVVG